MRRSIFLAILLGTAAAGADEHVVRGRETLREIARLYYGREESGLIVLASVNHLGDPGDVDVVPGQRLFVPVPRHVTAMPGESWETLAERTLGARYRAGVLARTNRAEPGSRPDLGRELVVPIVVTHQPDGRDTLATIAKLYYGAARGGVKLLRDFNDARIGRPSPDRPLLVPFPALRISPAGQEALARSRADQMDGVRAQAQAEITAALPGLEALFREGKYSELVAAANQQLGRPEATGNQRVTLHRLLAYAYVALDREALALEAFREALRHQPDLELNPVTTSPKILRVLREARRAPPQSRPAP